ncbi:MAG: YopX family protein [Eubacteriales bacterium]|nr:YopX family protein [Eubacteriales bacterium]
MNNRYIFRGKRKDNGTWVDGNLVYTRTTTLGVVTEIYTLEMRYEVIPKTVGQCTGLKDKNGKLIFEGDIVEADGYIFFVNFGKCGGVANNEDYGYIGYYLDGYDEITKKALSYGLRDDICYFTNIEAIGNIHDNPELLQRSDEE